MLSVAATAKLSPRVAWLHNAIATCDGAQKTVTFAPMLPILSAGTRKCALHPTKAKDGTTPAAADPQPRVQAAIFRTSRLVLAQTTLCILVSKYTRAAKPGLDHSVNVEEPEGFCYFLGTAVETIPYLSLARVYEGIVMFMIGIYCMTPKTEVMGVQDETWPIKLHHTCTFIQALAKVVGFIRELLPNMIVERGAPAWIIR